MVRQSFTAVVERAEGLRGRFTTEPYEAGWASEAIVFLKVMRLSPGGSIDAKVQISPDGIDWADEGSRLPHAGAAGLYFVKLARFGGWLRLEGEVAGPNASADVSIYVSLKE